MALNFKTFKLTAGRSAIVFAFLLAIPLYIFYLNGIGKNPPGFYMDESAISYNAYLIATTGRNEYGELLPAYFRVFRKDDGTYDGYMNPTYIYALAGLNIVLPPSTGLSRTFSATVVFLACILLGLLAWQMSDQPLAGMIAGIAALLTPWLFELSRLVFEATLYPLALVLLLLPLYKARQKETWSWLDCLFIAAGLALTTYTYSIGRLLGPLFAVGIFLFAGNIKMLLGVLKTLAIYAVLMVPAAIFVWRNPGAMTQRYDALSTIKGEMSLGEKIAAFFQALITDIGAQNLLFSGDANLRHHVPVMGMMLAAVLILAIIGIVISARRAWSDAWYRYLFYGLTISVIPGVLTVPRMHMLRLVAFPVFLILLSVPAVSWLIAKRDPSDSNGLSILTVLKRTALVLLFIGIVGQAIYFQAGFRQRGIGRGHLFDESYPIVLEQAFVSEQRPIYLQDGFWGPAYIHAYYFSAVAERDTGDLYHLAPREKPPSGSIVLSSEDKCQECEVLTRRGNYTLFRAK